MSTSPAVPASEAPSTPQELLDWELSPGDAAAHVFDDPFYIVVHTHAVEGIIEAVAIDDLVDDPEIADAADAIAAVEHGAVDSGLQSGADAAADLFGGGDRDDDLFSL